MAKRTSRRGTRPVVIALAASAGLVLTAASVTASAPSLKAAMRQMAATTKSAKAALGSGDLAAATAVLKAYAADARSASGAVTGTDARAVDLRRRFAALAATAEGAGAARFKPAFGAIVGQCRSCHEAYK